MSPSFAFNEVLAKTSLAYFYKIMAITSLKAAESWKRSLSH